MYCPCTALVSKIRNMKTKYIYYRTPSTYRTPSMKVIDYTSKYSKYCAHKNMMMIIPMTRGVYMVLINCSLGVYMEHRVIAISPKTRPKVPASVVCVRM